jgi:hypothetical protein
LIAILLVSVFLTFFAFLATSFGQRVLGIIGLEFNRFSESLICSAAVGFVLFQMLFFAAQFTGHIRVSLVLILFAAFLVSRGNFRRVWGTLAIVRARVKSASKIEKYLLGSIAITLTVQLLAAMAPLTASDALHYHFAAPLVMLQEGVHPNFFLSHSFFCGEGHALILFGLAFGSERIAMGLLFLGGVLTAVSTYVLARGRASDFWAILAVLMFILTPLVAWQISSAGAPDLWMPFFATTGVVLISNVRRENSWRIAIAGGLLAGGLAGIKYTGCYVAVALAIAFLAESRSIVGTGLFGISAAASGAWPYLRNAIWTGDPVFPFLLSRLGSNHINSTALSSYLLDTGAAAHHGVWQLVRYMTFSWVDPARVGFWQFFGPTILAFLPLLFLAVRNTPTWRVTLVVWTISSLGLGLASSMARFLLVIYPIALIAVLSGVQSAFERRLKAIRVVAFASISFFLVGGAVGVIAYVSPALSTSLGFISSRDYLRANAPDYGLAEFINQSLRDRAGAQKTLVFFRHIYYLRVPFVCGDPRSSWGVDPSRLQSVSEWTAFFRENSVGWIVKSPSYPASLKEALEAAEKEGVLTPIAQTEVENFRGKRSLGIREPISVVILRVNQVQNRSNSNRSEVGK